MASVRCALNNLGGPHHSQRSRLGPSFLTMLIGCLHRESGSLAARPENIVLARSKASLTSLPLLVMCRAAMYRSAASIRSPTRETMLVGSWYARYATGTNVTPPLTNDGTAGLNISPMLDLSSDATTDRI